MKRTATLGTINRVPGDFGDEAGGDIEVVGPETDFSGEIEERHAGWLTPLA